MNNFSSIVNDSFDDSLAPSVETKFKFYLLIILQTPSFLCNVMILYHFNWAHLQTQIYGLLLAVNIIIVSGELSLTLYFLHDRSTQSEGICTPWVTLNYTLFLLSILLMTWTSIERYLFIYHDRFIIQHKLLLHYIPCGLIFLYSPIFYLCAIVFHRCTPNYDIHQYVCRGACYQFEPVLGLFDWAVNGIGMVMTTFIVNIILIIRHLIMRHRMKTMVTITRRSKSHRSLKLTLQLLGIAIPYIIAWVPYSLIVLVQIFQNSEQLTRILSFLVYLPYLQSLLLPFICILFIPEVKTKIITALHLPTRRHNQVSTVVM